MRMNAQEWLEQVKKLDELINAKLAERQRLIEIATDISAKPFDGMPHSNTGVVSQKMQNAVVNLIDLEHQIDRLIDQYVDYKKQVINSLEKLSANEYGVLHRYYIRYMTWEQVAEDMGVSGMTVWRWWQDGLKNLTNVVECYTIPVV
jgi:DNA-directed RNA polymerase specialized sigma subunit